MVCSIHYVMEGVLFSLLRCRDTKKVKQSKKTFEDEWKVREEWTRQGGVGNSEVSHK